MCIGNDGPALDYVEEGMQRFREIGMSVWLCHLRPTHFPREVPEENLSPICEKVHQMKLVKQSPSLLKSSVIDLFCRQDFT